MIQPGDLIPLAQVSIEIETINRFNTLGQTCAGNQPQNNNHKSDAMHDKTLITNRL
jgi:hypothetical protein